MYAKDLNLEPHNSVLPVSKGLEECVCVYFIHKQRKKQQKNKINMFTDSCTNPTSLFGHVFDKNKV